MPTEPGTPETCCHVDQASPAPAVTLPVWQHPPVEGAVIVQVLDDGTPHHHSRRTKARKEALDLLYQAEVRGVDPLALLHELDIAPRELTATIVRGVRNGLAGIDAAIMSVLPADWPLERQAALDRNLARIAVWEIMSGTAAAVAISEAVALADEYSTDSSAQFLSGILGAVAASDTWGNRLA